MYMNGQIVADFDNKQLVVFLGIINIAKNGEEMKIAAAYMNEEKFKSTPKEVSVDDCLLNLKTSHINFPGARDVRMFDDFDKIKEAIRKAGGMAWTQYSEWAKGGNGGRDYGDFFSLSLVDGAAVFNKNDELSGKNPDGEDFEMEDEGEY